MAHWEEDIDSASQLASCERIAKLSGISPRLLRGTREVSDLILKHGSGLTVGRSKKIFTHNRLLPRKRKIPEISSDIDRRASPFERRLQQKQDGQTPSVSRSPSVSSSVTAAPSYPEAYNGILDSDEHGFIFCRPVSASMPESPMLLIVAGNRTRCCFRLYHRFPYLRIESVCI